jgi:hypothetical protein
VECFFQDIDELQNHGIGASDLQKLKAAGICTVKVSNLIRFIHRPNAEKYTQGCLDDNTKGFS